MAIVSNEMTSYSPTVGNREDLANLISKITPAETPLISMIGTVKAAATKVEWQTDTNAAPAANAQLEGDTYTYSATVKTARVGNYNQIYRKSFIISKTQEAVIHAGRGSERSYQKAKFGQELKTDVEVSFLSNNASVAGDATTARQSGGLRAWIATNDQMGSGGASGGYNSSTGVVDAATNGTQRTFTKTLLDDAIQAAYTSGGSPNIVMLAPYAKRVFSTFMADANVAQLRQSVSSKAATLIGAIDQYVSDFGTVDVVPNRQMARLSTGARNVFIIDPNKLHKAVLRPIQEDKDVAHTADGLPCVLITEQCLMVDNEAAHAVVGDVFGLTSAT